MNKFFVIGSGVVAALRAAASTGSGCGIEASTQHSCSVAQQPSAPDRVHTSVEPLVAEETSRSGRSSLGSRHQERNSSQERKSPHERKCSQERNSSHEQNSLQEGDYTLLPTQDFSANPFRNPHMKELHDVYDKIKSEHGCVKKDAFIEAIRGTEFGWDVFSTDILDDIRENSSKDNKHDVLDFFENHGFMCLCGKNTLVVWHPSSEKLTVRFLVEVRNRLAELHEHPETGETENAEGF